jgi:hypothetical protein
MTALAIHVGKTRSDNPKPHVNTAAAFISVYSVPGLTAHRKYERARPAHSQHLRLRGPSTA